MATSASAVQISDTSRPALLAFEVFSTPVMAHLQTATADWDRPFALQFVDAGRRYVSARVTEFLAKVEQARAVSDMRDAYLAATQRVVNGDALRAPSTFEELIRPLGLTAAKAMSLIALHQRVQASGLDADVLARLTKGSFDVLAKLEEDVRGAVVDELKQTLPQDKDIQYKDVVQALEAAVQRDPQIAPAQVAALPSPEATEAARQEQQRLAAALAAAQDQINRQQDLLRSRDEQLALQTSAMRARDEDAIAASAELEELRDKLTRLEAKRQQQSAAPAATTPSELAALETQLKKTREQIERLTEEKRRLEGEVADKRTSTETVTTMLSEIQSAHQRWTQSYIELTLEVGPEARDYLKRAGDLMIDLGQRFKSI